MSFLKQYRINLCLMSFLGLAPFVGFYTDPKTIRIYQPFIVYNIILIILLPILSHIYIESLFNDFNKSKVAVLNLADIIYYIVLCILYTVVIVASIFIAPSHVQFIHSFVAFHETVCTLNSKDHSGSIISWSLAQTILCNSIWSAALFHIQIQVSNAVDTIAYCFMMIVYMTFMFHIRLITCLFGEDLKRIRRSFKQSDFASRNEIVHLGTRFVLFEKFLDVKELFESLCGKALAICAVFDFVLLVVELYLFCMYFIVIDFTVIRFVEGFLGYMFPFLVKNVMLARASAAVAEEVL